MKVGNVLRSSVSQLSNYIRLHRHLFPGNCKVGTDPPVELPLRSIWVATRLALSRLIDEGVMPACHGRQFGSRLRQCQQSRACGQSPQERQPQHRRDRLGRSKISDRCAPGR